MRAELENLTESGGDAELIRNVTEKQRQLQELFKDTQCDRQVIFIVVLLEGDNEVVGPCSLTAVLAGRQYLMQDFSLLSIRFAHK